MCLDQECKSSTPNMAQVYTTPTLWSVVIIRLLYSNLWVLAKCLEFCGVPYMVLLCFASKHINRSWTLLRAFGPHGLLTVYICVSTPSNEYIDAPLYCCLSLLCSAHLSLFSAGCPDLFGLRQPPCETRSI